MSVQLVQLCFGYFANLACDLLYIRIGVNLVDVTDITNNDPHVQHSIPVSSIPDDGLGCHLGVDPIRRSCLGGVSAATTRC